MDDAAARYERESDEVYYVREPYPSLGRADVAWVKKRAAANPRRRCRLCMHPGPGDALHQMLIVHDDGYFRPLRHVERDQSFQVVEGRMTLVVHRDDGTIDEVMEVAAGDDTLPFYLRCPKGRYYSFIVHTPWFVFLESAPGPMTPGERQFAPWAPSGDDAAEAAAYAARLREAVRTHRATR